MTIGKPVLPVLGIRDSGNGTIQINYGYGWSNPINKEDYYGKQTKPKQRSYG